jgi:hypothetical protein
MFIYFLLCSICRGIVYFSFRNNRLFINDDFIIRQSGAWDVDNEIIEPGKIQAITTSQLFWHKVCRYRIDYDTYSWRKH